MNQSLRKPEKTLSTIAEETLETAKGDREKAHKALAKLIRSDRALGGKFLDRFIDYGVAELLKGAQRHDRADVWHRGGHLQVVDDGTKSTANIRSLRSLYEFPLIRGVKLADATVEDLDESIKFYTAQADNMHAKAAFLMRVRDRLGNNETVRDALTAEDLEGLLNG